MNIRLMKLHLENFKCHKSLTLDFHGEDASIHGDNGTGKTSIYDGLTWLLFGKDSAGNGEKNIEIKPLGTDGKVTDHNAVTEVEAVLLADGEELTLKRTLREVWSTKRGSLEASYDGNTSDYSIDGIPCKAGAFKDRVAELVDEEKFRLLTNVSYFPGQMDWKKRREILFDLFGGVDDRQIMATDARFAPLAEGMGRHSLEEFKRLLASQRKTQSGVRNEIPARISECEKTIAELSGLDFDQAEADAAWLAAQQERIQAELLDIEHNNAADSKRMELREAKLELAKLNADNREFLRQQAQSTPSTTALMARAAELNGDLNRLSGQKTSMERRISGCEGAISRYREAWMEENAKQFAGSVCPTCGQELPEDKLREAQAEWSAAKKRILDGIVGNSKLEKAVLEQAKLDLEDISIRINAVNEELDQIRTRIAEIQNSADCGTVRDLDGYAEKSVEIQKRISSIAEELNALTEDSSKASAQKRVQLNEIKGKISEAQKTAGKRGMLLYAKNRIEELRESARAAAEALSQVEQMIWLAEEFSRYKAGFVEAGINGKFQLAEFRLFREQANGGIEDRCDVTQNGVPFINLNNGMRINVGIDIINTLSRAYGITVPLFVDNAESVTHLQECGTQVIRLVVDGSCKEVTING